MRAHNIHKRSHVINKLKPILAKQRHVPSGKLYYENAKELGDEIH